MEEKIDVLTSNPYFKRLYGVSQLGAVKYIYEKAKLYSRAEHCLFAAYLMREICKNLREKKDISAEDELNLVIASLLHDHHSTFSHSIELLIKFSKDNKWKNHKERSAWVIEKYFKEDIEEIGGDIKEIKKIILGKSRLSNLLSHKPLGTDKISYLLYDSLIVGKYSIKLCEEVKKCIKTLRWNGELQISSEKTENCIIKLYAFYLEMYREVYFSPEVKLYERILQKNVERLLEEGKINVNDLWEMKDYELEEMLKGTEYYEMLGENWIKIGEIEETSDKFSNPFEVSKKEKEIAEVLNCEENEILCVFIPSSSKLRTDDVFLCYENTWFLEKHKEVARVLPKEANKLLIFTSR